ncbi:MAG TPA: hypothetical protein VJJ21_04145 [Candidatus Nanoarchaeia archaeon]|nr:hypothetical protein [Candidatus Nanoarchaeia archaeon]
MKIKIMDEGRNLSNDIVELMSAKITESQAKRTLHLVDGSIELAVQIVNFFNSVPPHERNSKIGDYDTYLQNLSEGFVYVDERVRGLYNIFEEVVQERTLAVPPSELYQKSHRDDPRDSGHFYEHMASNING